MALSTGVKEHFMLFEVCCVMSLVFVKQQTRYFKLLEFCLLEEFKSKLRVVLRRRYIIIDRMAVIKSSGNDKRVTVHHKPLCCVVCIVKGLMQVLDFVFAFVKHQHNRHNHNDRSQNNTKDNSHSLVGGVQP